MDETKNMLRFKGGKWMAIGNVPITRNAMIFRQTLLAAHINAFDFVGAGFLPKRIICGRRVLKMLLI